MPFTPDMEITGPPEPTLALKLERFHSESSDVADKSVSTFFDAAGVNFRVEIVGELNIHSAVDAADLHSFLVQRATLTETLPLMPEILLTPPTSRPARNSTAKRMQS